MAARPITSQERTNLGPLTTTFTPPASCMVGVGKCPGCNTAWLGQVCEGGGVFDAEACWPQTTSGVPENLPGFNGRGFYSPGVICPAGHTPACSATAGGESGWVVQFLMNVPETAIGCCPTGFSCDNDNNGQTCVLTRISPTSRTVDCISGTTVTGSSLLTASDAGSSIVVYAPLIQLVFQESDLASQTGSSAVARTTASTGTGRVSTTTPNAGSSSNSSPQSSSSAEPASAGLASGAIAGIAVGVLALIIGIAIAAVVIWKRKRRQAHNSQAIPPNREGWSGPESDSSCYPQQQPPAEKPAEGRTAELDSARRAELNGAPGTIRQELPA